MTGLRCGGVGSIHGKIAGSGADGKPINWVTRDKGNYVAKRRTSLLDDGQAIARPSVADTLLSIVYHISNFPRRTGQFRWSARGDCVTLLGTTFSDVASWPLPGQHRSSCRCSRNSLAHMNPPPGLLWQRRRRGGKDTASRMGLGFEDRHLQRQSVGRVQASRGCQAASPLPSGLRAETGIASGRPDRWKPRLPGKPPAP